MNDFEFVIDCASSRITNFRHARIVFMASTTTLILFMFLLAKISLRASGGNLFQARTPIDSFPRLFLYLYLFIYL